MAASTIYLERRGDAVKPKKYMCHFTAELGEATEQPGMKLVSFVSSDSQDEAVKESLDWLDSIDWPRREFPNGPSGYVVTCIETNFYELKQSHGIRYYSPCGYYGEHVDQLYAWPGGYNESTMEQL